MIEIRLSEAMGDRDRQTLAGDIFSERFLISRPLLEALRPSEAGPPVLLIDELDRADEPFEAFLLEVLADYQITIPEIGTIRADAPPIVVITSKPHREIHDALKRRCLYHWIDYPDAQREREILRVRVPGRRPPAHPRGRGLRAAAPRDRLLQVAGRGREHRLAARAQRSSAQESLDPAVVDQTLGVLLKYQDDIEKARGGETRRILADVGAGMTAVAE